MSYIDMKVSIIPSEESCNRIGLFCNLYTTSENDFWVVFFWSTYIPCLSFTKIGSSVNKLNLAYP